MQSTKFFSSNKLRSIYKNFLSNIINDFRFQYRCPTKSLTAFIITRYWSIKSKPVVLAAINKLNVECDEIILEMGYGRGDGLQRVYDIIVKGNGTIYGLEMSEYMRDVVEHRFALELADSYKKLILENSFAFSLMPYPNNYFDGIYHVDTFYFFKNSKLQNVCKDLFRILKPGKRIVCAMELKRLKNFENYKILNASQTDPIRYLNFMESAGFENVKIEYKNIDKNGNFVDKSISGSREIQLLLARKPVNFEHFDNPEIVFQKMEIKFKEDYYNDIKTEKINAQTKKNIEELNKMKWENESK